MKEFFEIIKKLWKHPRYKALIKLGFWFIFLFLVALMIRGGNKKTVGVDYYKEDESVVDMREELNQYSERDSYEFSVMIKDNLENTIKLEGTYYNNKFYFSYNNLNYYYQDEVLYEVNEDQKLLNKIEVEPWNIPFYILDHKIIYSLIKDASKEYETKYKDGSLLTKYTTKQLETVDVLYSVIDIITTQSDDIIHTIEMNVQKGTLYNIKINYKNVNNITNFNKDYTIYTVTEKSD